MDFAAARATMLESQVRTNDVSDLALQNAIMAVPREEFVTPSRQAFAYAEVTSPTPSGRILWKPRDFAKLAQAVNAGPGDRVLVVAGAGGYSAAVFDRLGCDVTIFDPCEAPQSGIPAVKGDLAHPPAGPFDVIFVDGGVERVPDTWMASLAEGGRLALVVINGPIGAATVFTRSGDVCAPRVVFDATVPVLPGFEAVPAFSF